MQDFAGGVYDHDWEVAPRLFPESDCYASNILEEHKCLGMG